MKLEGPKGRNRTVRKFETGPSRGLRVVIWTQWRVLQIQMPWFEYYSKQMFFWNFVMLKWIRYVKMNLSMKNEYGDMANCLQFNKFRIFDDRANYVFVFLPMNIWRKITKSCKQKGHQGLSTNCFRCTVQQRLMANYEYIYGSYACCKICCKLMGSRSSSLHSEFVTYWF